MHTEPIEPLEDAGLIVRPSTDLMILPDGGSSALSEIISRSLAHIQSRRAPEAPIRRAGEEQEFEIAHGVKIVMCWIPPGDFLMGSPHDELGRFSVETQHRVTITQGYWLGKYQVNQAQWAAVMKSNPSHFQGPDLPVESVSWREISDPDGFLEKINRCCSSGGVFSLPTEAQWEYACRAGTSSALNNEKNLTSEFVDCPDMDEVAWYFSNSNSRTRPGGLKKGNAWGLHDMHGNVFEWCANWHGDYTNGPLVDPRGPDSGTARVNRGGGWLNFAGCCRAAFRSRDSPGDSHSHLGFRLAHISVHQKEQASKRTGRNGK